MIRLGKIRRRLSGDTQGMALTEFALLVTPLLLMLLGAFDLGYQSYVRSVMQGVLNDVARTAAVENPNFSGTGSIETRIQDEFEARADDIARNVTYTFRQTNFFQFSGVGNSEKLMTDNNGDGNYDAADNDCFEDLNDNGSYDLNAGRSGLGGANDVVFYEVTAEMPRIVPLHNFIPGMSDKYTITVRAAIRNQPYGNQPTPAVLCGA